jgi:MYXO-CTERM domain-containing protein
MPTVPKASLSKISRAPRGRRPLRTLPIAAFAAASLWTSLASAEQFVVVDATYEHTADMPDSHYRLDPLPGTPTDWRSPIDYASGTAHMYFEVSTKPTDTPTKFQACFEATPTYACIDQSPTYTTTGVYEWQTPFANFWSPPGEAVDWTKGTAKIALILKDTMNNKPSTDNVGAETASLYMPTKVRMVVTIVAPGSQYVPPTSPDAGVPGDAGPTDPGPDASTGAGGQGAGGSGGSSGTPPKSTETESGCSVASTTEGGGAKSPAWFFVAATALLVGRTRRRGRTRA